MSTTAGLFVQRLQACACSRFVTLAAPRTKSPARVWPRCIHRAPIILNSAVKEDENGADG